MKKYFYILTIGLLLLAGCVFLEGVDQPASATAGQDMTFTMRTRIDVADGGRTNVRYIIGFIAPRSWNASANTNITFTSTSYGSGKMVAVPSSVISTNGENWPNSLKTRFGMGGNFMPDDLEWVVFWTEQAYNVPAGVKQDINITVTTKTGPENTQFKTGYFLGTSSDGLSDFWGASNVYKSMFKDCFQVTGGQGDLIDFCNPQIAAIVPGTATDNDFITISFDPDVVATPLNNVSSIYLCAKAYTTEGDVLDACVQQDVSKLQQSAGKKSAITLWPRAFFNVPEGKTLTKIEYFFTDASGAVKVGYGNTASPFVFTFKCQ